MNHTNPPNHEPSDDDHAQPWSDGNPGRADGERADGERTDGERADGETRAPGSELRVDAGAKVREILDSVGGQLEKLAEIQREHEAATAALDDRERFLIESEDALRRRQTQLAEEQAAIVSERETFHAEEQKALAARSELIAGEQAVFDREREQWEERRSVLEAGHADREAELGRRESDLAEHAARIAAEREHVGATGAALEEARESARESAREQVAALESQLQDLQCRLDAAEAREETQTQRISELTRQADEARQLLEEKTCVISEHNDRIEHMMTRCAELEASLAASDDRADQLETAGLEIAQDVEIERDAALGDLRTTRAELEEARRQIEQAEEARKTLEQKIETLEKALAETRNSAGGARSEIGTDVRVQAMQLRINKLEAKLVQAKSMPGLARAQRSSAPGSAPGAAPGDEPPAAQADREEEENRLKDFRAKAQRLAEVAEHLRRRQTRLRKARRLLRNRKPVPVKQVVDMEQHAAQMRHIGQQRHELAEKRSKLVEAERRMIRKWARSRSIVLTGWIVFMAVVAAGSSWLAVEHFKPAIVSASVTMEAKSKSRQPLTDEASALWQSWHAGLAQDDRFHETLAQRFDERRMDAYGVKKAVDKRLEDLTIDSSQTGKLTFTLAGTDAGEIKAVLDVVATSIVTESDTQRRKRGDNAWAELPPARSEGGREAYATLDPVPIEDQRLNYAGPTFGVILIVLLLLSRFICGRIADVKHEFDADGALFDPMPPQGGRAADGTVTPYDI